MSWQHSGRRGFCRAVCITLIVTVLLFALVVPAMAENEEDSLPWIDYEAALEQGKTAGKPLLLFFRTRWCYQCKEMKRRVFRKKDVSDLMKDRFLLVDVDIGKEKKLQEIYRITYVPTTVFLDQNGKRIMDLKGFVPHSRFLLALKYIAEGAHRSMDFQEFEKNNR